MTDKADDYIKEYIGNKGTSFPQNLEDSEKERVPKELVDRVKKFKLGGGPAPLCPHCGKGITSFKKPLLTQRILSIVWFLGMAGSFAASFAMPRYFFQFVAAAVLFGVKWIVDQRSTKTQILIYKALQEDSPQSSDGASRRMAGRSLP